MVLIPKVNADTQDIVLLEVLWILLEAVMDNRIKTVVQFHYILNGFSAGIGEGAAIMYLKLT